MLASLKDILKLNKTNKGYRNLQPLGALCEYQLKAAKPSQSTNEEYEIQNKINHLIKIQP